MNEVSIQTLFNFILKTLPELFQKLTYYMFTPLRDVLGENFTKLLNFIYELVGKNNALFQFINNWIIEPIFNIGLIGLFSATTIFIIIILKLIDLVIPI